MTIERTRELLGEDVADLTDEEVLRLIQQRSDFCDVLFEMIEKELLTPSGKEDNNG